MYSDIEGGLGWWRDTRFPTETLKFIMGGVVVNFKEIANGPAHGCGIWDNPQRMHRVWTRDRDYLTPPMVEPMMYKDGQQVGDRFYLGGVPINATCNIYQLTVSLPTAHLFSFSTATTWWATASSPSTTLRPSRSKAVPRLSSTATVRTAT